MWQITSIINKNIHQEVCPQYLHKPIDVYKSIFTPYTPLKIIYTSGSFFTHEIVLNVDFLKDKFIKIETIKKIWILEEANKL